jgi:hypothetical protein
MGRSSQVTIFSIFKLTIFGGAYNTAISAIKHDKELKMYHTKRVSEGKPKMLVLNIIRNKLVSRIFATANRGDTFR